MTYGLTMGRIVHAVLPDGIIRPAIVTHVWTDQCVQATVFLDATNEASKYHESRGTPFYPASSLMFNDGQDVMVASADAPDRVERRYPPHTWHWPPRS
jgi:hypothetical protein